MMYIYICIYVQQTFEAVIENRRKYSETEPGSTLPNIVGFHTTVRLLPQTTSIPVRAVVSLLHLSITLSKFVTNFLQPFNTYSKYSDFDETWTQWVLGHGPPHSSRRKGEKLFRGHLRSLFEYTKRGLLTNSNGCAGKLVMVMAFIGFSEILEGRSLREVFEAIVWKISLCFISC